VDDLSENPTSELLPRARAGEAAAIAALHARFEPRVRGFAAVRLGRTLHDLVDCDDIVQEAMSTAFTRLRQFEGSSEGAFVCWLAAIVEARVQDALRSGVAQKRGGGRVVRRADLGVTTVSALSGPDGGPSPSQAAAHGELDAGLSRALLALGTPLREIVFCRLVLEMDFGEITSSLQLSSAESARAQFHKALVRLRERLPGGDERG
jgi:RNA polymerase sigma-70 factor (ECF subfamily)